MASGQWLLALDELRSTDETWIILVRDRSTFIEALRSSLLHDYHPYRKCVIVETDDRGHPVSSVYPVLQIVV